MKLGLLTIHATNNYGAILQAFAMQEMLGRYGEVRIIDYRSSHVSRTMDLVRVQFSFRGLMGTAKDILRLSPRRRLIGKFEAFICTKLNLTSRVVERRDLGALESQFDVFVSGSDQIWNNSIVTGGHGFDAAFFLDFVKDKLKISYASSVGACSLSQSEAEQMTRWLQGYAQLSVRETDTAEMLSAMLGRPVAQVLDPTLLLSRQDWLSTLKLTDRLSRQDYIFVYVLKKDGFLRRVIDCAAKKLRLKVVAIDQDPFSYRSVTTRIADAGPVEFVDLLSNASFVITNSFHGTAFAINFGIPFICVKPVVGVNRVLSLLDCFGLRDSLVSDLNQVDAAIQLTIPFDTVHAKLEVERAASIAYLDKALVLPATRT